MPGVKQTVDCYEVTAGSRAGAKGAQDARPRGQGAPGPPGARPPGDYLEDDGRVAPRVARVSRHGPTGVFLQRHGTTGLDDRASQPSSRISSSQGHELRRLEVDPSAALPQHHLPARAARRVHKERASRRGSPSLASSRRSTEAGRRVELSIFSDAPTRARGFADTPSTAAVPR